MIGVAARGFRGVEVERRPDLWVPAMMADGDITFAISLGNEKARLDEVGVEHSGLKDVPYGTVLTFRDPDNIQLEFYSIPPGA